MLVQILGKTFAFRTKVEKKIKTFKPDFKIALHIITVMLLSQKNINEFMELIFFLRFTPVSDRTIEIQNLKKIKNPLFYKNA